MVIDMEIMNKLYLELSHFVGAKSHKESKLEQRIKELESGKSDTWIPIVDGCVMPESGLVVSVTMKQRSTDEIDVEQMYLDPSDVWRFPNLNLHLDSDWEIIAWESRVQSTPYEVE